MRGCGDAACPQTTLTDRDGAGPARSAVHAESVHELVSSQVLCAAASTATVSRPCRTDRPPDQEDPRGVQSSWSDRTARPRQDVLPLRRRTISHRLSTYSSTSTISVTEVRFFHSKLISR